jgi:DNA-binding SARP family transcriptional activator
LANARVLLLDGFAVEMSGPESLTAVGSFSPSEQRLVARVSLSGRPGRAAVAGQLWPDIPESHAKHCLRSVLWRLQKAAPGLVDVSNGALQLSHGVAVDVREFECWARKILHPDVDIDSLDTPPTALHGELLPGWYDDWVLAERERVQKLRMHALEQLAEKLASVSRFGEAVEAASAAVQAEPMRESSRRILIRVYRTQGNVVDALQEYETFRAMLATELDVMPTPLMEELVRPIRTRRGP